jgi:hypothetical protein
MSYFIFLKDSDNIEATIYKIAENQSYLNNLNILQNSYKIIEDSQSNFNSVKLRTKLPIKYNNNTITYIDQIISFKDKNKIQNYVNSFKQQIKNFTDSNPNHPSFNLWDNYYNQLNNLNLDSITYPLDKSLEQYFSDVGQTSLNPLQIP